MDGGDNRYYFKLYGSTNGSNEHEFLVDVYFNMKEYSNIGVISLFPSNGHVTFSEFDTLNGKISGSFSASIESPDGNTSYELSEGIFKNIELTQLFCEPEYPQYQHDKMNWNIE